MVQSVIRAFQTHPASVGESYLEHLRFAARASLRLFGGACAGLAGAQLSVVYTPQWVENMSAGRGWIALALVVFASWRPWRIVAGAA